MSIKSRITKSILAAVVILGTVSGMVCGSERNERTHYVSMQQLLISRDQFIKEKVMVTGYLSANCVGLCLFAYKDDAMTFNSINSIQIFADGETINRIETSCSGLYVTIVSMIDSVEGFAYPGFINIDHIRMEDQTSDSSKICWQKEQKK